MRPMGQPCTRRFPGCSRRSAGNTAVPTGQVILLHLWDECPSSHTQYPGDLSACPPAQVAPLLPPQQPGCVYSWGCPGPAAPLVYTCSLSLWASSQGAGISEFTLSPHPHPDSDGTQPAVPPAALLGPWSPRGPSLLQSSPASHTCPLPLLVSGRAPKQFPSEFSPELAVPASPLQHTLMGSSG